VLGEIGVLLRMLVVVLVVDSIQLTPRFVAI
jgi:hypothetical protein